MTSVLAFYFFLVLGGFKYQGGRRVFINFYLGFELATRPKLINIIEKPRSISSVSLFMPDCLPITLVSGLLTMSVFYSSSLPTTY